MTTFKDFLMEASEGSVDIRKDPYANKIEQILRKEIEKKYPFLGKLLEADFNLRYNSTKAEPKLYLFYDIKGNEKDIDDNNHHIEHSLSLHLSDPHIKENLLKEGTYYFPF